MRRSNKTNTNSIRTRRENEKTFSSPSQIITERAIVTVRERERKKERKKEREKERKKNFVINSPTPFFVFGFRALLGVCIGED